MWLTQERVTYAEARRRILAQFGLQVGNGALSAFWQRVCEPRMWAAKNQKDAETANGRVLLNITVRMSESNELQICVAGPAAGTFSNIGQPA